MRSASICVLPEPAPASTSRFTSSCSRTTRRDSRSTARESDMVAEPPIAVQLRVRKLLLGTAFERLVAGAGVVAEPAVVLRRRVREGAVDDHRAKVGEHTRDRL